MFLSCSMLYILIRWVSWLFCHFVIWCICQITLSLPLLLLSLSLSLSCCSCSSSSPPLHSPSLFFFNVFDLPPFYFADGLEKLLKNLYKNVMFSKLEYATKNGSLTLKTLSTKQDKGGDMENPKNIIAPKLSEVQTESSAGLDHDNKYCHQHSTEMEDMEIDHCEQCRYVQFVTYIYKTLYTYKLI